MENIQDILSAIRLTPPTGVCTSVDWKKQKQVAEDVKIILEVNRILKEDEKW